MINGVKSGRQFKQGQSRNFTLVHTNNNIAMYFDFDDELKISLLISSSDARLKTFILDLISDFCTCGIFCTLSGHLERIVSILSTKYLEK